MKKQSILLIAIIFFGINGIDVLAQAYTLSYTNPVRDGANVNRSYKVEGIAEKPSGEHVWLMVHRLQGFKNVYWPQGEVNLDPVTKKWDLTVTFGNEADVGYEFEIVLIVVDETVNARLNDYLTNAMVSGNWTPMRMPEVTTAPVFRTVRKVSHNI